MLYAEIYGQSNTVSSDAVTVSIPAGPNITPLIVIDSILATGLSSGTGALTLEHNITGGSGATIFARSQLPAATQPITIHLDFAAGWPMWITSGNDTTPGGATTIVLRGPATLSSACLTVTYHYEKASSTRN